MLYILHWCQNQSPGNNPCVCQAQRKDSGSRNWEEKTPQRQQPQILLVSLFNAKNRDKELWAQVCSRHRAAPEAAPWRGTARIPELQAAGIPSRSTPWAGRTLSLGEPNLSQAWLCQPCWTLRELQTSQVRSNKYMEPFRLLQWEVCEGIGNQYYQVKECFWNLKILRNILSLFSTLSFMDRIPS